MAGRGGAGNILRAQEQTQRLAEDIEANRSPASASATIPSDPPKSADASPTYAHTGRGGAGNWCQPSELAKEGTFSTPSDATALPTGQKPQVSTPWHPEGQEMPVARAGRGGAGNFVWRDEEREARRAEEQREREEKVREGVERDVEVGLRRPEGAVLGGQKGGRGW